MTVAQWFGQEWNHVPVFDEQFLNDSSGDCTVPSDSARWLGGKRERPFALVSAWVTDPSIDGPVYAIELLGAAVSQPEAEPIAHRSSLISFVKRT